MASTILGLRYPRLLQVRIESLRARTFCVSLIVPGSCVQFGSFYFTHRLDQSRSPSSIKLLKLSRHGRNAGQGFAKRRIALIERRLGLGRARLRGAHLLKPRRLARLRHAHLLKQRLMRPRTILDVFR
ncbi:MAG: hypothetical protein WDM79_07215 [Terricaulis sp.]